MFVAGLSAQCGVVVGDIPGLYLSSGGCLAVGPGGGFVVGGLVFEAAVEDADESVGEGA